MKKLLLTLCCAVAFHVGTAHAGLYGSAGIGASLNDGSVTHDAIQSGYKNTPVYAVAAGYELPLPILDVRGEIEYLRIRPNVKQGPDSKFDGVFLNGYADIPFVPVVDPYVGLGLGYSRFDHTNSPALQGMAGIEYELPILPIAIGGEYRYMKVNETGGKWDSPSKFHTNIFMLKARYTF